MTQTALVLMFLGVFIAVLGWVMGRSRPAHADSAARSDSMNASARRQLAARGLNTGSFGAVARQAAHPGAHDHRGARRALAVRPAPALGRRHRARGVRRVRRGVDPRAAAAASRGARDRRRESRTPCSTATSRSRSMTDDEPDASEILPADESPTLDLTADDARMPRPRAAAASAPPKGKSPRR